MEFFRNLFMVILLSVSNMLSYVNLTCINRVVAAQITESISKVTCKLDPRYAELAAYLLKLRVECY